MNVIHAQLCYPISIGYQAENSASVVAFDVRDIIRENGEGGQWSLTFSPAGSSAYPIPLDIKYTKSE